MCSFAFWGETARDAAKCNFRFQNRIEEDRSLRGNVLISTAMAKHQRHRQGDFVSIQYAKGDNASW